MDPLLAARAPAVPPAVALAVTLPFDADQMRTVAIVAIVVLLVLAFLVARFVQKLVFKAVGLVVLLLLALLLWTQRASLRDCADKVAAGRGGPCSFLGFDVDVPATP